MTTKRTTRRSPRAKKTDISAMSHDATQAWLLIQTLTCKLIGKLDAALREADTLEDGWERLFGAKDSTVVNVQKLVAVLAEISDRLASATAPSTQENAQMPMAAEDMSMLKRWLEEQVSAGH